MKTVLDHQTQAERDACQAALRELREAQTTLAKHEKARQAINDKLREVKSQDWRSKRKSFEAFEAGTPAPAPPLGPSETDLNDALAGCEGQILDDKEAVHLANGALRARKIATIRACADRLAATYVTHAQQLHAAWTALAGADELLQSVTGSRDSEIVDGEAWKLLYIPASKSLPALEKASADVGDGFHTRVLANEAATYSKTASTASDALQRAIIASLGAWPFGASVNYLNAQHMVNVAAQVERVKEEAKRNESRRAAIARAAEKVGYAETE